MKVIIVGGGIAGLTLACGLAKGGIRSDVYEVAPQIAPLGLGVNLLPHSTKVMAELGVLDEMRRRSVETVESTFFNRYGQHIYSEPAGLHAGYDEPQLSIHRGDIQEPLLHRFVAQAGAEFMHTGRRCVGYEEDGEGVTVHFADTLNGAPLPPVRADVVIAADGLHSVIRKQMHPGEGDPVYSGVNMWRGAALWKPFLQGGNMTRIGWLSTGKLVIYPIRNDVDGNGNQLINWVVEIETPKFKEKRDWNKEGSLDDFFWAFKDMKFDWLDVPGLLQATEKILEFPMVDQDPLPFWTTGRVTLMGDAAHPMYPRGSNGAGQAILDAACLAKALLAAEDPRQALRAYEAERLAATSRVVLMNRSTPPDIILKVVHDRTGGKPFERIEDVISAEELAALSSSYKRAAGYDREKLAVAS
ncbi:flavin-dependent oxidoreductase [Oleomonas cavernae]|uniref:Flavin-dependent oxidoreductase n=1 Tax=Oleomonas cavernae TaxID=2320859 RepID=A0A418WII0_9PROT|nr:flavin-dependent oxidoreductase [Oleomonas cavernae]RJF89851.1 flavin-dependent oxidoreductase [Oleomonas cavernae]